MIQPATGIFDGDDGQQRYEAALKAMNDVHECLIDGRVLWQFDRYEFDYPGGQKFGVRMAVAVCPECGQRREDNAEQLESAIQ